MHNESGGWCTVTDMIGFQGRAQRMQAALSPVLVIGPEFLAGRVGADDMAHTMVRAVEAYVEAERGSHQVGAPPDEDSAPGSVRPTVPELEAALAEVYGCGSGYLAHRCDSDCVARTMTQIMGEFGDLAPAR